MSETASPREVAAAWFRRLWVEHDGTAVEDLMAPDAVGCHEGGLQSCGPGQFREFHQMMLRIFPDLSIKVVDIVSEGDRAYVRWEAEGTFKGDGMGLKANGVRLPFNGVTWLTVQNGRITGGGDSWNQGALLARMAVP